MFVCGILESSAAPNASSPPSSILPDKPRSRPQTRPDQTRTYKTGDRPLRETKRSKSRATGKGSGPSHLHPFPNRLSHAHPHAKQSSPVLTCTCTHQAPFGHHVLPVLVCQPRAKGLRDPQHVHACAGSPIMNTYLGKVEPKAIDIMLGKAADRLGMPPVR